MVVARDVVVVVMVVAAVPMMTAVVDDIVAARLASALAAISCTGRFILGVRGTKNPGPNIWRTDPLASTVSTPWISHAA